MKAYKLMECNRLYECPECGNRFLAREPDDGRQLLPVCPKCGTAIIKS